MSKLLSALAALLILVGCATSTTEATDRFTHEQVDGDIVIIDNETDQKYIIFPTYTEETLEMLACVIYQEAGGDACCDDCRRRVADVVLNRVNDERFPGTVFEVLTQKGQYGFENGIVWPARAVNAGEGHAVERAYRIAKEVLEGQHSELFGEGYIWQATFVQGKDNLKCCGTYFGR